MQKDKKYPEYSGKGNANWKGGKTECQCEFCGKTFYTYINKTHKGRFCSKECRGKGYKGENNPCYRNAKIIKKCKYADGDYWHGKPERKAKDKIIDQKLRNMGYFPQRIKGSNIKKI